MISKKGNPRGIKGKWIGNGKEKWGEFQKKTTTTTRALAVLLCGDRLDIRSHGIVVIEGEKLARPHRFSEIKPGGGLEVEGRQKRYDRVESR